MINWKFLYRLIESRLEARQQSARSLAKELGISVSTITRLKQGKAIQAETFCIVLDWLKMTHRIVTVEEGGKG